MLDFKGYHGTSLTSAKKIVSGDYRLSIGDNEWLGNGVYFFIDGISSKPEDQAKEWAITESWDKTVQTHKYHSYAVIKSDINVNEDNILDLTKEEGVEVLEYLINNYEKVIKKVNTKLVFIEGLLINLARKEGILPIEVVKGNFYIKFAAQRLKRINLRTSNCTICTVYEPAKNITNTIIVNTGDIKNETY